MRIDHLVYAVPDLAAAIDDIEHVMGVRAAFGGQHLGRGTHNALLALGSATYLEVIAPDPEQPEHQGPRPFGIDVAIESHLAGWAVACEDIDAAVRRAREMGYDPGEPVGMQRATPDGTVLRWRLTLNAIAGGCVPFLIEWGDTPNPASGAPKGLVLDSFAVLSPDSAEVAAELRALGTDVPVTQSDQTRLVALVRGPNGGHELR